MQLGPNNSEMQRSQRNLTLGAFSVLMPFVAVVQAFVVMGLLHWAWRAKRWLLALVAILAIITSVLAGLDWRRNHVGDRLHLSDEQRPGRVWALNEAQAAWDRMRGEGGSRLRTTVIPNLFVYLEAGDRRAAYVDPQMGWMLDLPPPNPTQAQMEGLMQDAVKTTFEVFEGLV